MKKTKRLQETIFSLKEENSKLQKNLEFMLESYDKLAKDVYTLITAFANEKNLDL